MTLVRSLFFFAASREYRGTTNSSVKLPGDLQIGPAGPPGPDWPNEMRKSAGNLSRAIYGPTSISPAPRRREGTYREPTPTRGPLTMIFVLDSAFTVELKWICIPGLVEKRVF